MWTNYRIRITNPEIKTEEYHFDGATINGYHRDSIQLNRPSGQSVSPSTGASTRYNYLVVGGVKGKIYSTYRSDSTGNSIRESNTVYNPVAFKPNSITGPSETTTSYIYNSNGTLNTYLLPSSSGSTVDPYKIYYTYETTGPGVGVDPDKTQRYLVGTLKTLLDIDYHIGTRDIDKITNSLGQITSYTWHPNGLPITTTDQATGDTVSYIYDQGTDDTDGYPTWRLLKVFKDYAYTGELLTQIEYDPIGRPVVTLNSDGYDLRENHLEESDSA